MKIIKLIFTLSLVLTLHYASAQLCTQDNRYTDSAYFTNTQTDSLKNVTYGTAVNYLGEEQDLKIDLYFPKNDIDTLAKRPFILLIHGGGFFGGQKEGFTRHCKELAKRGFVTATMSYRLGFDPEIRGDKAKAVYRAQQDANTALSYVAKHAEKLRIDTSWVFIGGSSAGAVTSLYTTYGNQEEWNGVLPQFESILGPLKSSEDDLSQQISIKGIYNFMGAVFPIVFASGDLIPTISFHGELDETVPIGKSPVGFGSRPIHDMLNEAGICNDFTIVPEGDHSIYRSKEDVDFRINRVACFFKSLICNSCEDFLAEETVPANCTN
jgi:acetyl esterase/lipase